ncbi:MAG: ferritin [Rhodopirellula sp.]|nr:ferritin [Rhodopirellula sp.]
MALPYHEPVSELSPATRDVHRALSSVIEELEAIDWYNQRADVTADESLKAVLIHNRDEEIEHAAMTLEWLRRRMPPLDEAMKTYLYTMKPITEIEEESQR